MKKDLSYAQRAPKASQKRSLQLAHEVQSILLGGLQQTQSGVVSRDRERTKDGEDECVKQGGGSEGKEIRWASIPAEAWARLRSAFGFHSECWVQVKSHLFL